jgi:hypothetical protein
VNPAVHMSAPHALRPPLRTVFEEAWQTFSTRCAGRAVKYGQQPVCAAAGPIGLPVLSMSGYPCRGWRDNSKKQCIIIDVTFCEAIFFRPRREGCFRVFIFLRYVLSGFAASLVPGVLWVFRPLCVIRAQGSPSRGLALYSNLLNESLKVFSSWVFRMIT